MEYSIGVDIGGTNISAGLVENAAVTAPRIVCKDSVRTEPALGVAKVAENVINVIQSVCDTAGVSPDRAVSIGIGCPGSVDSAAGIVNVARNLNFTKVDFVAAVRAAAEAEYFPPLPIYLENDANCAAMGEYAAGAARGTVSAVIITLGTGVGGGIITSGKVHSGVNGGAGELGHMVVKAGGHPCNCGRKGCFEVYCSATGLIRRTRFIIEKYGDETIMKQIAADYGKVSARTAFQAAKQGDAHGTEVVNTFIELLGAGITNIINILQPDIVCVGGVVANEGEALLKPLREYVAANVFTRELAVNTKVALCELGNDAGIIGAAVLSV